MPIRPDTLKHYRIRATLSQDALADASCVSKKTITRIESGKKYVPTSNTVKKLAKALKVTPQDLAGPPNEKAEAERQLRDWGYQTLKSVVEGTTALAFDIVEFRYGISRQNQIEMAPLFAALLAEASLSTRREKLAALENATDAVMAFADRHLAFAAAVFRVEPGAEAEAASIAKFDIFGKEVYVDFDFGGPAYTSNPFADYLCDFATKVGNEFIEVDSIEGSFYPENGLPEFRIGQAEVERITGGKYWAIFALQRGYARLRSMPSDLLVDSALEARVAWLTDQIPAEARREYEALHESIKIDISDLDQKGESDVP